MQKFFLVFLVLAASCKDTERQDTSAVTLRRPSPSARQAAGLRIADSCLAQSKWTLGPVTLNAPTSQALSKLGSPTETVRDSSEDDGGIYQLTTYRYKEFEFDDVRGDVDRVLTNSPSVSSLWGVRPGITRDSVSKLLARYGVRFATSGDTLDVADCGAPSAYLTLAFTPTGAVKSVQIAAERP